VRARLLILRNQKTSRQSFTTLRTDREITRYLAFSSVFRRTRLDSRLFLSPASRQVRFSKEPNVFFSSQRTSCRDTRRDLQYSGRISDTMLVKSRTCWRPGTRGRRTWNTEERREGDGGGGRGSYSEGQWKAKRVRGGQPGGSLGRFLDRSSKSGFIPRQVSGTSTPRSFPISPSLSSNLCSPYTIQNGGPGFSLFFSAPGNFPPTSSVRQRRENTQTISFVRRRSVSDVRESRNPRGPSLSRANLSVGA